MYRKYFYFLISLIFLCFNILGSPLPELYSDGAILIEPNTRTILYAKNINETFYPASTTKILSCLILLEDLPTNALITKTSESIQNVPSDSSHIGVKVGDQYTALDGLHGILLGSDNFIAYDMAVKDAGSIAAFADKMNAKAKLLGATSSHFVNPHGYHDEMHYTTPYDLSQIAIAAFQNPELAKITGTKAYNFLVQNKSITIPIKHTALLFDETSTLYNPHVVSAKTGYHTPAKRTLVAKAVYDDIELIAVVMRSDAPHQYEDINNLFAYGSQNYSLSLGTSGEPSLNNHTYSTWAKPYITEGLEEGWLINTAKNYTTSISKRELINLLESAIPASYKALLQDEVLHQGNSIYKENLPISRKEVAQITFNLLEKLGLTSAPVPKRLTPTDLAKASASYDEAIEFSVSAGILSLTDQGTFNPNNLISYEEGIRMASKIKEILNRYESFTYTPPVK